MIQRRFENKEQFKHYADKIINTANDVINCLNECKEVVNRFDGKVLNKRLFTAMNATPTAKRLGWSFSHSQYIDSIELYIGNPSFDINNIAIYYKDKIDRMLHNAYNGKRWEANKPIDAEIIIKAIERCINANLNLIERYKDAVTGYERYMKKLKKLEEKANEVMATINPLFASSTIETGLGFRNSFKNFAKYSSRIDY